MGSVENRASHGYEKDRKLLKHASVDCEKGEKCERSDE